jgi:hypothetical protein
MNDIALRAAIAAVWAWTKFYTWGLPFPERSIRCEEIESDIWESVNDPGAHRRLLPLQIVARLVIGIPDDLGWRSEYIPAASGWRWRVAVTMLVAIAMFGWWLNRVVQPDPVVSEMFRLVPEPARGPQLFDMPPPPPPPPPPCPPQGFPQPTVRCIP